MRRPLTHFILFYLAFLLGMLVYCGAEAREPALLKLDELSLNYRRYHKSARHPLFHESTPKEGIDLNMNTDLLWAGYWDNTIHSMTNSGQYYLVGWEFKLGVRLFPSLHVEYRHQSQHVLDDRYPYQKFPVEDSVGFTLYIVSPRERGWSIF